MKSLVEATATITVLKAGSTNWYAAIAILIALIFLIYILQTLKPKPNLDSITAESNPPVPPEIIKELQDENTIRDSKTD